MKRLSLLTNLLLVILFTAHGQAYEFSVSTSTYTPLSGATSVNNDSTWDDPDFVVPIGFYFKYFSTSVNEIHFGWGLGGDLTFDTANYGIRPVLFPFGNDLTDRAYDTDMDLPTAGSESPISYLTTGNPGARVFKLEWKNAGFYDDIDENGSSTDYVNFQLWLYENSNKIEIHFGPSNISDPDLCYEGETGPYIALFGKYNLLDESTNEKGYVLSGSASNPSALNTTSTWSNYIDGTVADGTVYTFRWKFVSLDPDPQFAPLKIYPVPAKDMITIEYSESLDVSKMEIFNVQGVVMLESEATHELSVSELAAGVYYLRIHARQGMITKQIIIE